MCVPKNTSPYFAKVIEEIPTGKNTRNYQTIGIFQQEKGKEPQQIGSYQRNYSTFYRTFFPFIHQNGKWYALYSPYYTSTRIMELPSCKDIGGEEDKGSGFCPVEYYVPTYVVCFLEKDENGEDDTYEIDQLEYEEWDDYAEKNDIIGGIRYRPFGFVAGCVWGDDWSWKIQYLDLSQADKGIIKREAKFGYIWLPSGLNLKDVINTDDFSEMNVVQISLEVRFDIDQDYHSFEQSDIGKSKKK